MNHPARKSGEKMPVKLGSKLPTESAEARIEIIPLIDIMFFLLASFMLVSLSMVTLKTIKVNLPATASAPAASDSKKDVVDLSIDKAGALFIDKQRSTDNDIVSKLAAMHNGNANLRVVISGDRDARHGDVIRALDLVRSAGIEKVAFEIRPKPVKATSP
ncbi:MAG: exbD [Phycisphaerales bacterium]|jgi:biopolymer transport protein ExbD|nr:exbD [Phycisphaerales bacterium]